VNIRLFFVLLWAAVQAAALLFLSHYGLVWAAVLMVLLPQVVTWWRRGRSQAEALAAAQAVVGGVGLATIIGLDAGSSGLVFPPGTQVILAVVYACLLTSRNWLKKPVQRLWLAAADQLLAICAIFLISAFWHWPAAIIVAMVWAASFVVAWSWLASRQESAGPLLAAAWALITAEVAWVLQNWLVSYIIAGGYVIIPQAALVILGLGYCFVHIYLSHTTKMLSRRRLLEYITITAVLLIIIIVGTRGTVSG
jgi:hypothetical protein